MKRIMQILSLAGLVVIAISLCTACSTKRDESSVFERGTWALATFEGKSAPFSYSRSKYTFDYNEHGQVVESRKSTNSVNIITGQNLKCTWADDGLSYACSYTLAGGNVGEKSNSGTSEATFEVEYDELSAGYVAHGERILNFWQSGDNTVRYALEYRADGTLKHKEVEGRESADRREVFDYDEHGNLVRYERSVSGEKKPREIRTYDIVYEGGTPKSVTVTATFPSDDEDAVDGSEDQVTDSDESTNTRTYELTLHTDDKGNVVSANHNGREMASMSWVYVENPDPLSRLRIQAEAASAFDLL